MVDPARTAHPRGTSHRADDDRRRAREALSLMLLGEKPLVDLLHDVCRLAVAASPGVQQVSITLVEVEGTTTVAFSGPLAATLDERQYEAGFGPCVDAAQSGGVVRIEDTSAEALYPDFAAVARRQGVTSVLAVGLPMPAHVLGALNCYRLHGGEPLDSAAEAAVSEFAVLAGVALANATLLASRERAADRLQRSLETRAVIEQAKGIVMQVTSCDAEEAFQLLAKRSQHSNRKLRDIAADVVERASRGGPVDLSPPADGR